jgi:hypothetical protein
VSSTELADRQHKPLESLYRIADSDSVESGYRSERVPGPEIGRVSLGLLDPLESKGEELAEDA